jgi:FMN-dependent NADH-azoreductase
MRLLIVNAFENSNVPIQAISESLAQLPVTISTLNLAKEGFGDFMSEHEREAYHLDNNLVSPAQKTSAELVKTSDGLILCYPLINDLFPPIAKSWFERVFIPGVSFTFAESGRVKGALKNLRHIHFLALTQPTMKRMTRSNPSKSLLRAIRMNAGLKCRSSISLLQDLESFGIVARENLMKGGRFSQR